MMNRDQMALHLALEAAHKQRDARRAQAYVHRRAAKNRKPARDLFSEQLGLPANWRDDFLRQRNEKLQRRRRRTEERRNNERHVHRQMLDEMRMSRWRDARGAGLRDW